MNIIEWIVDFFEFFKIPIGLLILILLGYRELKKDPNKYANNSTLKEFMDDYSNDSGYSSNNHHHQRNNEPDFSYMSHDEPEEPERDLLRDGWNGEELDPTNPDHYAVYDMYDDRNN
ncbi:hypothetical protein QWY16_11630 [Planococcus shenhongbingii]|uniref:hypothetical protein n=1 Tax=Planococcus shenhongbingii TaxID=3058398 RepID=UPI0026398BF3|nr:hypothetical protein [Planococcus sp. N016]WKA57151.1 hypothetical protein QWY16_11630 [Planococcus sp. N016]